MQQTPDELIIVVHSRSIICVPSETPLDSVVRLVCGGGVCHRSQSLTFRGSARLP